MSEHPTNLIPGAEPLSHEGGPVGVLVLHGFTGNPATMRPLADALAGAGFSVEMPRLPGHGTVIDDMLDTRWDDWLGAADAAYDALAARVDRVAIAGLSMGGTLTTWLAAHKPDTAAIVCINPLAKPPDPQLKEMVRLMLEAGETVGDGVGSDIADPDAHEPAYAGTPLAPALSMFEGVERLQAHLPRISCPVLLITSEQDHVVPPENSDHLAEQVSGPVERVLLHRSYHVATLDYDKHEIAARSIDFVRKVTG